MSSALRFSRPTLLNTLLKSASLLSVLIFTLITATSYASAQNSNGKGTSAESKPGQSTPSTYARDKVETVNLANGNFSLSIPLATVGGRGSAAFTVALSYNSKVWTAQHDREFIPTQGDLEFPPVGTLRDLYTGMYDKLEEFEPGLAKLGGGWTIRVAPGIKALTFGIDPVPTTWCNFATDDIPDCGFKYVLTKMWLTLPDGSQVELRDSATQGAPARATHISDGYRLLIDRDRGRIWRSTEGSGVIFVRDPNYPVGQIGGLHYPSGWIFMADGTRMRMDAGVGSKIIDRNGNFVDIGLGRYTDGLGRQTELVFSENTVTVRVKGYMGSLDRSISINTGIIGDLDNLRADFRTLPRPFTTGDAFTDSQGNYFEHTIESAHTDLFNHSEGIKAYGTMAGADVGEKIAVTRLSLLDGRSLRFRYNQYGEVSEIVYPGGGVSQIDYFGGVTSVCEVNAQIAATLNRTVSQRRTLTDGTNVDATWIYGLHGLALIDGTYYPTSSVEVHEGGATGALLSSETHFFLKLGLGAEYRPCFGPYTGTGNEKWQNAKEFRAETQTGTGTVVTVRNWEQRAPVVWANDEGLGYNAYVNEPSHAQDQSPNDARVTWDETTLEDGKVKRVEYGYDQFNNITSIKEYDFGTAGSAGNLLRQTYRTYVAALNGNCYSNLNPADPTCGSGLATDVTSIIYQPRLLLSETVKDAGNIQKAYSEFEFDKYTSEANHAALVSNSGMIQYDGSRFATFNSATQPRGNVTKATRWLNGGTDVVAYSQYDNAGQTVWSKDPNGNVSNVSYGDNFGIGANPDPAAGVTGPAGPTFAIASVATNALGHQVKMQYDYSLGAATGVKDANGVITKTEYDNLGRPFRTTTALGLAEQSISQMSYPTVQESAAKVSKQLDATHWLASKTDFDGFDRPTTSWKAEDGQDASLASFSIRANTIYDAIGRVKQISNPYRPATETPVYTTTAYDMAGRVISVTTPDNAVETTSYSANTVTVIDQTQRQRKSVTDALGRLKEVYEDPNGLNYLTSYGHDTLDNLMSVSQGTQTRTFVHDSLKRLRSAFNPESETIAYQYDSNGNLTQKTDARGVVSTYSYDALNRNMTVTYTNDPAGTPMVHRYYDGFRDGVNNNIPNSKGRLWQTETGGSTASRTTINSFDSLGRPASQSQQFYSGGAWSQSFSVSATYDKVGNVLTLTYPSGHTTSYSYDGAGRTSSFTGNLGEGVLRTYANDFQYTALGGLQQEKFGTDTVLYHKQRHNQRGQLWDMLLSTVPFATNPANGDRGSLVNYYSNNFVQGGNGVDNNGNLLRQEINIPGNGFFQDNFIYDSLNRLKSVAEKLNGTGSDTFKQAYTFDRWGNRTIDQANTTPNVPHPGFTVNAANNRLNAPAGYDLIYDEAGNLTDDSTNQNFAGAIYDAENRLTQVSTAPICYLNGEGEQICYPGSSLTTEYVYDGDGRRVRRTLGSVPVPYEIWQVYGFTGELLGEYPQSGTPVIAQPQKEYGYRDGQLLVTAEPWANVALNKPASQIDNYSLSTTALKAVNGDANGILASGAASATNSQLNSWWQVDLQNVQTIASITVWGRTDCCPEMTSNFYLFVSDSAFTSYDLETTRNQAGVYSHLHSGYAGPASIPVNRTGRYVRVQLAGTGTQSLALAEVQVWSAAAKVNWLVTDHLGTPRMIVDKSGSLAGVSRHDYLPFGEEILVGIAGRTTAQGYDVADGVRQKFTSKERDNETGLDYFGARYYSSIQARFTSVDPGGISVRHLVNPQKWNRYVYTLNNPLKFIDPDGLEEIQVVVQTFIPQPYVEAPGRLLVNTRYFEGDDRDVGEPGGFRTQHIIVIETDPTKNGGNPLVRQFKIDGPTHELSGPNGDIIDQATGSGDTLEVAVTRDRNGAVMIHAKGDESNVLVTGSPGITYDLNITVTSQGTKGNATAQVSGAHDGFPAYEVLVSRPELPTVMPVVAYGSDPRQIGKTPMALFPPLDVKVNTQPMVIPAPPPPPPPAATQAPKKKKRS